MKAVVYHGPRQVSVDEVPDARVERPTDALVKITATNICGSDLHMYEGRTDFEEGSIFGHENVGEVVEVGTAVDKLVTEVSPDDYDALLLPGGTVNPDQLRINADAVAFVKAFAGTGKPIAAICHGPWTLITAGVVRGRRLTSWPSLRDDLRNAGAEPVDEEVVIDGQFTTSRSPADLPAFCPAVVEQFASSRVRG